MDGMAWIESMDQIGRFLLFVNLFRTLSTQLILFQVSENQTFDSKSGTWVVPTSSLPLCENNVTALRRLKFCFPGILVLSVEIFC